MPPRKKQIESTLSVYADFAADVSDDALIAENFKLEDLIKAAQAKMDEWARPHKERVAQIEAEISRRLLERKSDSTKTDSGTAYFSDIMDTKIESTEKLFDFISDRSSIPVAVGDEEKEGWKIQYAFLDRIASGSAARTGYSVSLENVEDIILYIKDYRPNWTSIGADVKLNLPIGTVRAHMDNNNGALPPGMTHSFFKRLNIKRS